MRYKRVVENGNVAIINRNQSLLYTNSENRDWLNLNSTNLNNINNHIYNSRESNDTRSDESETFTHNKLDKVCNEEYLRTNQQNNIINSYTDKKTDNLDNSEDNSTKHQTFLGDTNVSLLHKSDAEEVHTELSKTDEMTETGKRRVLRGIVNPNYPGFQHLAHTLQNYSSNLDNSYHSENDMTDDDADTEITETSCDKDIKWDETIEHINLKNNNIDVDFSGKLKYLECCTKRNNFDSNIRTEIPDLLRSLSKSNNNRNSTSDFDLHCTDADIENNFNTEDIIGNFNKEVEDEIKHLLNYNINIQDDLEELRKDIKESFAKPIENTINNISDVVNHVIKKLVESNDCSNQTEIKLGTENINSKKAEESRKENHAKEMIVNRPTFLLIENNKDDIITDAYLSDGKDEIEINENNYDTELLSYNVERTIQQLSSELRKIIPKLDEMRQQDKYWEESSEKNCKLTIDGNSNEEEMASCSNNQSNSITVPSIIEEAKNLKLSKTVVDPGDHEVSKNKQKESLEWSDFQNAQNISSVHQSSSNCNLGNFDVYTIETALPQLDIDAIENHIKAAKEAERRKLNDREEIRRRLAMGTDYEEYYSIGHSDRPGKKPSLHSRLQNGKNLQICFMNETASDNESQTSDAEKSLMEKSTSHLFTKNTFNNPYQTRPLSININKHDSISTVKNVSGKIKPTSLLSKTKSHSSHSLGHIELKESDFYALQATLQTEARIALAQAKEMASIQMERERRARPESPVTEMLRRSLQKANVPLAPDRRRVSRQLLTDMNIAQLQVIVNELHGEIESLNESLVRLLMQRDELHMGQDSMLVDIEDLTRYLGVKEQSKKTKGSSRTGVRRLTTLVNK